MQDVITHLSKDKKLKKIIERHGPIETSAKKNVYLHLCFSIMSQQLSTKVADVFIQRFLNLYKKKYPSVTEIAATSVETLRSIGLSNAKANYIKNVCDFFIAEKLTDARLYKMSDEEIINYLTKIKGVGKWTVEMILMFTLGRENIFSVDDLGIQQSMMALYKIEGDKKAIREKMYHIAVKWQPYRTYACMYLWRWKDNG